MYINIYTYIYKYISFFMYTCMNSHIPTSTILT